MPFHLSTAIAQQPPKQREGLSLPLHHCGQSAGPHKGSSSYSILASGASGSSLRLIGFLTTYLVKHLWRIKRRLAFFCTVLSTEEGRFGCRRLGMEPISCKNEVSAVCKAITAGLFSNATRLEGTIYESMDTDYTGTNSYSLVRGTGGQGVTWPRGLRGCCPYQTCQRGAGQKF